MLRYLVSRIGQVFEWEKCWLLSKECLWHFRKAHLYATRKTLSKVCKIYSCITSALKEVEAFRTLGSALKIAAFLFSWDEAGFASSMKVDSHNKYWCNENSHADCGNTLHDLEVQ